MPKKQSYLKKKKSFSGAQILLFTLVFAAVGAVAIWQSLAAPHGGGKPSGGVGTISLVMVTDKNNDGLPNFGDTITFKISDPATDQPFVDLKCSQNGALVMHSSAGFFPSALNLGYDFTLLSGAWTGGAADCTATLLHYTSNGKMAIDGTTTFHVNA